MKELHGAASATVAAPIERCFEFLGAVEDYPDWYPETVRSVEVVERDGEGRAVKARATLHVALGPLVRDFRLLLAVSRQPPGRIALTRIAHDRTDREEFEVSWRLREGAQTSEGAQTEIGVTLDANLSVPRLLPVGGLGEGVAQGFVSAAARALR
jgi:hypothetical protein